MRSVLDIAPKLVRTLRDRVGDTRGFTLAEQLVSIVFLGLLCVVIGVGLNAALNAYRVANESTRANELLTRAVEEVSDELAFAPSVEGSDSKDPITIADCKFVSPTLKRPVVIGNDPNGGGITLVLQEREKGADGTVSTPFPRVLVASSHGLTVQISDVAFNVNKDNNNYQYTWNYTIAVTLQGSSSVIASTSMTVAWTG